MKEMLRRLDYEYGRGLLFLLYRLGKKGEWARLSHISGMLRNPVIIGGCGRSGTGLLLSLLSVHPEIYAVPGETKAFCPGAYSIGEFPDAIENVASYDPNEIDPSSATFHPNFVYSHLLDDPEAVAKAHRWCEKTPKNILFAKEILDYFGPGAQFLHIVRDGRNVVTSRHPGSPDSYYVPPERWVRDVSAARKVASHPQLKTVRYEDLTTSPLQTLRDVFDFLGESCPESRLKTYPESSQFTENKNDLKEERRDIILSSLSEPDHQRYKKEEHTERVARLMKISEARKLIEFYGYE